MSRKLNFPHKPLRIINPFKPGGFSDTIVEKMTPKFSELLGQEIEVEYRHGFPGGCVAPEYVATSEPDGHTLLIGTIGNIALLPTIYPGYKIDPLIDLAPITLLAQAADILVTHPAAPFSTFEEMCDFAKQNPGKQIGRAHV